MTRPRLVLVLMGSIFTGVMGQGTLVVSGILVARMLSVPDRGIVALATVLPFILVQVGTFGVPRAITFESARLGGSPRLTLTRVIPLAVTQSAFILVVGAGATLFLSGDRPELGPALFLALASIPIGVALQYGLAALQGLERYRAFNVIRLMPAVIYALLVTVIFASGAGSATVLILCWIAASAISASAVLLRLRMDVSSMREPRLDPPATSRTALAKLGFRSFVGSISPLGSMGADQLVVGVLLSPASLGIYVIASSICNLPRFLAQSIGMVAYPHVATLNGREQAAAIIRLVIFTSVVSGAAITLLEISAGILIPVLFGTRYADAVPVARFLLLAAFFFGIRRVLSDALQGAGHPVNGAISEGIAWITLGLALAFSLDRIDPVRFAVALSIAAAASAFAMGLVSFRAVAPSRNPTNCN
ncbi:MAG: lipopolysaccharide biosynthesis protein [Gammaproteobacteria bacterium]